MAAIQITSLISVTCWACLSLSLVMGLLSDSWSLPLVVSSSLCWALLSMPLVMGPSSASWSLPLVVSSSRCLSCYILNRLPSTNLVHLIILLLNRMNPNDYHFFFSIFCWVRKEFHIRTLVFVSIYTAIPRSFFLCSFISLYHCGNKEIKFNGFPYL